MQLPIYQRTTKGHTPKLLRPCGRSSKKLVPSTRHVQSLPSKQPARTPQLFHLVMQPNLRRKSDKACRDICHLGLHLNHQLLPRQIKSLPLRRRMDQCHPYHLQQPQRARDHFQTSPSFQGRQTTKTYARILKDRNCNLLIRPLQYQISQKHILFCHRLQVMHQHHATW